MLPAALCWDNFLGVYGNPVGYVFALCLPLAGWVFGIVPFAAVFLHWVLWGKCACAVFWGIPYEDGDGNSLQPYTAFVCQAEPAFTVLWAVPGECVYFGFCGEPGGWVFLYYGGGEGFANSKSEKGVGGRQNRAARFCLWGGRVS